MNTATMSEGTTYGEASALSLKMRKSLAKAVMDVCWTDVGFMAQARIDGLIGITLDNTRIILVNIYELIQKESQTPAVVSQISTVASRSVANASKSCDKSITLVPTFVQQNSLLCGNEQQNQQDDMLHRNEKLREVHRQQHQMISVERQHLNSQQQVLQDDEQPEHLMLHDVEQQKQKSLIGKEPPIIQVEDWECRQCLLDTENTNLQCCQNNFSQMTEQQTLPQQQQQLLGVDQASQIQQLQHLLGLDSAITSQQQHQSSRIENQQQSLIGQTSKDQRLQELLELTQASSTRLNQLLQTDSAKRLVQQLLGFDLASINESNTHQTEQMLGLDPTSNDLLNQLGDPLIQQLIHQLGLDRASLDQQGQLTLDGGALLLSDIQSIERQLQEINGFQAGRVSRLSSTLTLKETSKSHHDVSASSRHGSVSSVTDENISSGFLGVSVRSITGAKHAIINIQQNSPTSRFDKSAAGKLSARDTSRPEVIIETGLDEAEMIDSPEDSSTESSNFSAAERGTSPNPERSCEDRADSAIPGCAVNIRQETVEILDSEDEVDSFSHSHEINCPTQCCTKILRSTSVRHDAIATYNHSVTPSFNRKTGINKLNEKAKGKQRIRSTGSSFICPHCNKQCLSTYYLQKHCKICHTEG